MTLDELRPNEHCTILDVTLEAAAFQRLLDLGFVNSTPLRMIRNAPLLDPLDVEVRGAMIAIRRSEARGIEVELT
jgi:ferrous iron transport protein A